jgi:uncharacterized protein (DUF736 family)
VEGCMSYEPKDDTGNLWRNDKRENDKQPEFRGDAKVVCPHCQGSFLARLSAWVNEAKGGKKYFGIKFSKPEAKVAADF